MNTIPKLLLGAALASLTPSLIGCATKPIIRTETVTVERPVITPVPAELTRVDPEPTLPAGDVTNEDLVDLIEQLKAWGRGMAGQLRAIADLEKPRAE